MAAIANAFTGNNNVSNVHPASTTQLSSQQANNAVLGHQATQAILDKARQMGLTGKGQTLPPDVYQGVIDSVLGNIQTQAASMIPPGSTIVSANGATLTYQDPQGYQHTLSREQNTNSGQFGQLTETSTNRPSILPDQNMTSALQNLYNYANSYTGNPTALAQLDPQTAADLKAISDSEQAQLNQQFQQQGGDLLAQLYGNRLNQSTIGNSALGTLLQQQGLVQAQQQANAANRDLTARQFLTTTDQQKASSLLGLLSNLSGQQTTRDVAGGNLSEQDKQLALQKLLGEEGIDTDQYKAALNAAAQEDASNNALLGSIIGAGAKLGTAALAGGG